MIELQAHQKNSVRKNFRLRQVAGMKGEKKFADSIR